MVRIQTALEQRANRPTPSRGSLRNLSTRLGSDRRFCKPSISFTYRFSCSEPERRQTVQVPQYAKKHTHLHTRSSQFDTEAARTTEDLWVGRRVDWFAVEAVRGSKVTELVGWVSSVRPMYWSSCDTCGLESVANHEQT